MRVLVCQLRRWLRIFLNPSFLMVPQHCWFPCRAWGKRPTLLLEPLCVMPLKHLYFCPEHHKTPLAWHRKLQPPISFSAQILKSDVWDQVEDRCQSTVLHTPSSSSPASVPQISPIFPSHCPTFSVVSFIESDLVSCSRVRRALAQSLRPESGMHPERGEGGSQMCHQQWAL